MSSVVPPLNIAQLNARMEEVSRELGVPIARVRLMLCTLIVSQMLPDAVAIKGWDPAYRGAREETEVGGISPVLADIVSAGEWLERVIVTIDAALR